MRVAKDVLAIVGTSLVLGVACGVLWWLVVDPATFTKVAEGASMGEVELGKRFNGDGWYSVIAAVSGLLAGALLTWWRSRNFLLTTVLLLLGAAVAALVMAATGHLLGPGEADAALAAARVGAKVPQELGVTARATYLVWPISMLVGALMVLWSGQGAGTGQPEPGRRSGLR